MPPEAPAATTGHWPAGWTFPVEPGEVAVIQASDREIRAVALDRHGRVLASGGQDNVVKLWDAATGSLKTALPGQSGTVNGLAFSPDGRFLINANYDATVKLRDAASGRLVDDLVKNGGDHEGCLGLGFSADGKTLAVAAGPRVRLWNAADWTEQPSLALPEPIRSVAFGPDGKTLAVGLVDKTVRLWDLRTRSQKAELHGHNDQVWAVAFAPRGNLVASAGGDKTIKLWSAGQTRPIGTLEGHTDRVYALAFTPDGNTLVSGGEDGTLRVWDVTSQQQRLAVKGHPHGNAVYALAFSGDGKLLASGTHGLVKLWDVSRLR